MHKISATTFNDYQQLALTTAVYPARFKIIYPAIKLAGEAGELAAKVANLSDYRAIQAEAGDVLWYLSALASDFRINFSIIASTAAKSVLSDKYEVLSFEEYELLLVGRYTLPPSLNIATLILSGEAGEFADYVGKWIRKDCVEELDLDWSVNKLACVLTALSNVIRLTNGTTKTVADANLDKVLDRKDRGVTHGIGDNR